MKSIYKVLTLLVISASFTSCLKDDGVIGPEAPGYISNVIEFKNPAVISSPTTSTYPLYVKSFESVPDAEFPLTVSYSGAETAPADIAVKVVLNNSVLGAYNDQNEADYVPLSESLYDVSTYEVVIPKGQKTADITISVKPDQIDFENSYALGFTIESASEGEISGNFGTVILSIIPRNQFDGVYRYKTSANTSLVPNANTTVQLETISANRVQLKPGLLATYSNEVFYIIDEATGAVTVDCPSLGVQEPQDTRSVWDPETRGITVFWKQGNGGRTFEEQFEYIGPRS